MQRRISIAKAAPGGRDALYNLEKQVSFSGIAPQLYELIKVRASQINGCAHCINIHTKDALTLGETSQRLFLLDAWRETNLFSEKERAVLALTESVTLISAKGVSDTVYDEAAKHLSEKELGDVIMAIIAINCWNRISLATAMPLDNISMLLSSKEE